MKYFSDKENLKLSLSVSFSLLLGIIISRWNVAYGYLVSMILVLTFIFLYIKKRDDRVNDLNQYLKKLNQGDFKYNIEVYEEGELAKLQSELNKTIILVQNMNVELSDQKIILQNALEDIAHQLKTPISSLLLLNELQENDEIVLKSKDQLMRLNYLSDSLLKLIRLDANLEVFSKEEIMLSDLLKRLERLISPLLNTLTLDIIAIDALVFIDVSKTVEAMINVLNNKLRYAKHRITILVKEDTFFYYVEISDDGEAIKAKDKVFDRFYSGKKKDSQSIGIGLSIAKEYMLKQENDLYIRGSNTFVFKISKLR